MKRKELEKWYTICIIICSFVLIVNIWYAVTFAPDIRKEILYGIMMIVNFFTFSLSNIRKARFLRVFIFSQVRWISCICVLGLCRSFGDERSKTNYTQRKKRKEMKRMLILLKDEDRVINTQCISEIFIRYDNKKCEYDLICTLNQAVSGCNQKVLGRFEDQEDAAAILENIVNQYGRGQRIYKMGEK